MRARLELAFAGLTGVLFVTFALVSNASKVFFAAPCIVLWSAYAIWRTAKGERRELGLTFEGLGRASIVPGAMVLAVIAISVARRVWLGWTPPPSETWLLLLIYPPWAFVQQLIVQVFVAKNLAALGMPAFFVVVTSAIVFGAVHAPDWTLVELCTGAGLVWTWWFRKHPTLIPLAIAHGWAGAFVYGWILERSALN
jgi:hypothetical protein